MEFVDSIVKEIVQSDDLGQACIMLMVSNEPKVSSQQDSTNVLSKKCETLLDNINDSYKAVAEYQKAKASIAISIAKKIETYPLECKNCSYSITDLVQIANSLFKNTLFNSQINIQNKLVADEKPQSVAVSPIQPPTADAQSAKLGRNVSAPGVITVQQKLQH